MTDSGVIYPNFPTLLDLPAARVLRVFAEMEPREQKATAEYLYDRFVRNPK